MVAISALAVVPSRQVDAVGAAVALNETIGALIDVWRRKQKWDVIQLLLLSQRRKNRPTNILVPANPKN